MKNFVKMSDTSNGDLISSSTFTIKWKVKQFLAYFEGGENDAISPELLTVYANTLMHWRLRLSKNYDRDGYRSFMSVYLDYLDDFPTTASVIFAILDSSRQKRVFQRVTKAKFDEDLKLCGIIDFVQQDLVTKGNMDLLVDDSLIIMCEIRFQDALLCAKLNRQEPKAEKSSQSVNASSSENNVNENATTLANVNCELQDLSDDLEKLLVSEKCSDVSLIIGERKIRAHKNILACRSLVFEKIFAKHENVERKRSLVGIQDVKYDVMKEVVRFVYAGKVNGVEKMPTELLVAAEKYGIHGLKPICEEALCEKLNFDNALAYLSLAKTFNAVKLSSKAMDYVISHLGDYVSSPQFRELSVDIKDDLLNAVSKKKNPS